jgi:hypothetical protein
MLAAAVAWAAMVGCGLFRLQSYAAAPGPAAQTPARWPDDCPLRPASSGVTLVLSLHPHCPCSRATVGELAELMARGAHGVKAYVLMVKPNGMPEGWERTSLHESAARIPGVTVLCDDAGQISRRFGALTSGQTFAFDSKGRCVFSGGITAARGHMGDNAGSDALTDILCGRERSNPHTPVFGCTLGGSE